ncbi:MAG: glycerol kinase GlpK [Planctomycetota bacterium]|nr:glycerol kinase [Planctomycetota bacterium]MDP6518277.1 glycerol kinase GlpK [Planctomycetota bacterium]MDP6839198.1 glycerol kinase GlpK [Planctomycetota bacterium]
MTETILAIDAGTTGVTSIIFDADLAPLARASQEFSQGFPRPGWVEHEAHDILRAVDETVAQVIGQSKAMPRAIGITNQRETVFAVERAGGRALAPGIVWQDRRTSDRCAVLKAEGLQAEVSSRTGLVLDPYFSASKIEWMLANTAGLSERAAAGEVGFCTVDTLVIQHLCGGGVFATDHTNAARTMLYNLDKRAWDPWLCDLFGVSATWLPEVRPSAGDFGEANIGGVKVPILGVAGDQQAALFGQGCWDEGSFKNTYGTGCFLLLNTGKRRVDSAGGLLTTLAVARDGSPCYALEGSVFAGGLIIQWLRDNLGLIDDAAQSEALARSVDDSGGVYLVPAFAGLGAPYWDADARAALLGMTRGTGPGHIARAALEGIAFQSAEIVELLRAETGLAISSLRVDGGAAANDFLMQCQADLAALTISRGGNVEATARGAAALAGLGVGLWSDPSEARAFHDQTQLFEPGLAEQERRQQLEAWRQAVARVRTT